MQHFLNLIHNNREYYRRLNMFVSTPILYMSIIREYLILFVDSKRNNLKKLVEDNPFDLKSI